LQEGSLNVRITDDGCPPEFQKLGTKRGTKRLDEKTFSPEFVIPKDLIRNNKLGPTPENPDGGDAQVWSAKLVVDGTGATVNCWVVRRMGSALYRDLEIVSERHLRTDLNIEDGTQVTVYLQGQWNQPSNGSALDIGQN